MATERLDRLLSRLGYCSRSEVRKWLSRVRYLGQPVKSVDQKVEPDGVEWDGAGLDPDPLWILMHKPLGLTCSHHDRGPLVFDLFPERYRQRRPQLSSVGRLDKDTSGVLLFTTDGQALHRLTSPRFKVEKVYRAVLERPPSPQDLARLEAGGLTLADDPKPLLPCKLECSAGQEVLMTLIEGRYHQVRRMWELVDNQVLELHRERFGPFSVAGLKPGDYRLLTADEIEQLFPSDTRS